jgi:hypothetical protein
MRDSDRRKYESQGYEREMRGDSTNCFEDRIIDTSEATEAREVGAARAREDKARSDYEND